MLTDQHCYQFFLYQYKGDNKGAATKLHQFLHQSGNKGAKGDTKGAATEVH